ncbi:MAG TPA: DUF4383 domain-containing protein [Gemmatimonadaceae bacterium]|nr:DUF4383 domain-containing protein [Gemmatimonadaceae bacterium]
MLSIQRVATYSGALFILLGVLAFTPVGMPFMQMGPGSPMLLGLFPVNALHNVVHMLFGVWGLIAGRNASRATVYALGSGAAYLLLGVLGMFTNDVLGIVIGGYDVVLHLFLAVTLASLGCWALWSAPEREALEA